MKGSYFNSNFSLRIHFDKIGETDSRNLLKKIVYVELGSDIKKEFVRKIDILNEDDGLLMYGYIDEAVSFSFHILSSTNIKNNALKFCRLQDDTKVIIRKEQPNNCKYLNMNFCEFDYSVLKKLQSKLIKAINILIKLLRK